MTGLDPAAIMAAHQPNRDGYCKACGTGVRYKSPCLPYHLAAEVKAGLDSERATAAEARRLAAEVTALRDERDEAVNRLGQHGTPAMEWREVAKSAEAEVAALREQVRRVEALADSGLGGSATAELRAALAGEGAVDQPQPEPVRERIGCGYGNCDHSVQVQGGDPIGVLNGWSFDGRSWTCPLHGEADQPQPEVQR